MIQQYTHSITKEAISELPLEEFTGRIIVIDTLKDAEKAISYLSEFQSVGFDTETRPMRRRKDIQPANFLDLQNYVGQFGIEDASLQKIYAILFNKKISKGQRLSNWEADVLSDAQKKYAALDAWACLKIYNQLKQI